MNAHGAGVEAAQALVADGDPVGVAAEVVEDLLGSGEGPLRVDHPFGLEGRAEVLGEPPGSLRGWSRPAKRSCPASKASCNASRRTRRKKRERTRTGRKNPGRQATIPLRCCAAQPWRRAPTRSPRPPSHTPLVEAAPARPSTAGAPKRNRSVCTIRPVRPETPTHAGLGQPTSTRTTGRQRNRPSQSGAKTSRISIDIPSSFTREPHTTPEFKVPNALIRPLIRPWS